MIIKRIILRRFRKFKESAVSLSPGLNIIRGENEAGKSTLQLALRACLFSNPASRSAVVQEYISWGEKRLPEIMLEFSIQDNDYILRKDFENRKAVLREINTGQEWSNTRSIREKIADYLGLEGEEVFRSSTYIDQVAVSDIAAGKKSITASLGAIMTGGQEEVDINRIINVVERQKQEMEVGLKKLAERPGILKSLAIQREALEQEISGLRQEIIRLQRARAVLASAENEWRTLEQKYLVASELLENNRRRREIEEKRDRLQNECWELETRLMSIEANQRERQEWEKKLSAYRVWKDVGEEEIEQFLKNQAEREVLVSERDKEYEIQQAVTTEVSNKKTERKKKLIISSCFFLFGLIGGFSVSHWLFIIPGSVVLFFLFSVFPVSKDVMAKEYFLREQAKRIASLEQERRQREVATDDFIQRIGSATGETLKRDYENYCFLREEKKKKENELKGQLGSKTLSEWREKLRELQHDLRLEEDRLMDPLFQGTQLEEREFQQLIQEVRELEKELRKKEAVVEEEKFQVRSINASDVELAEKEERLTVVKKEEKVACRKAAMLELLYTSLSEARDKTLVPASGRLEELTGKYFSLITNGAYQRVVVNGSLNFSLSIDESDFSVTPEQLSRGTIDQFYLSARLALVDVLAGGKNPPLFLDDPFVTFDQIRLERTLGFFRGLARQRQIILFTCRSDYDSYADKVIDLGREEIIKL